jgi:tetrahydromethanopterin S-methyltransferase subunit G
MEEIKAQINAMFKEIIKRLDDLERRLERLEKLEG